MRWLLVDRIDAIEEGRRARGAKLAAQSEDVFEWHFPERPIVPGMIVLEAFVQLAGWLEAKTSDFERWALLDRVETARYYAFAVPGDVIELEVEVTASEGDRRRLEGTAMVDGKRTAIVGFEVKTVALADLEDPDTARRRYAQLAREEA